MQVNMVHKLTYETLRYIFNGHMEYFAEKANTPLDIKRLIYKSVKHTFTDEADKQKYLKYMDLCDYPALFDWFVDRRNYLYSSRYIATALLLDIIGNKGSAHPLLSGLGAGSESNKSLTVQPTLTDSPSAS